MTNHSIYVFSSQPKCIAPKLLCLSSVYWSYMDINILEFELQRMSTKSV